MTKTSLLFAMLLVTSSASAQSWFPWITEELNPFVGNQREERDRSNLQVDCKRVNEFVTTETMRVDGQTMTRRVVKDEKYVRCLQQPRAPWVVDKTEWSPEHERGFEDFIVRLGASDCKTVDTCMASAKANPFLSEEDLRAFHYSDCADFPVYLRAYYAYKNRLPFSYLSGIGERKSTETTLVQEPSQKTDFRYTREGNLPHARRTNLQRGQGRCFSGDFFQWANCMVDVYHTGMARMSKWDPGRDQPVAPDYYSPAIKRESIRPGTVVYDSNGHISIVYKVAPDGEISLIMASPGGDVKRSVMSRTYAMDGPKSGSGFKNWRPFKLQNVKRDRNGTVTSGSFVFAKDEEIPDFSMEQYFGHGDINEVMAAGKYEGTKVRYQMDRYQFTKSEFLRFARIRLMSQNEKMNPVREVEKALNEICREFEARADLVKRATDHKIAEKPSPRTYPENIFGSVGEWENYSSPGRDARIRQMVLYLKTDIRYYSKIIKEMKDKPLSFIEYTGLDLKDDLARAYQRRNYACMIRYRNSEGKVVDLTLSDLLNRLALLSFDPYQCIERRWGAKTEGEAKSCRDGAEKAEWYRLTQFLRNLKSRPSTLKTNKTLAEFRNWVGGKNMIEVQRNEVILTKDTSADYDLLKVIMGL